MNAQLREKAIQLRLGQELSYAEIRSRLGVPKSTLCYWLRELPLSKERILELRRQGWQKSEAKIEIFRATMREKREQKCQEIYSEQKKKMQLLSKDSFFTAGLMLYLSEGNKMDYSQIALANTDCRVIKFFIQWLDDFLGIAKDKVKVALNLYENMDIEKEKKFWQDELGLAESQFYKTAIRKLQKSSFSYKESFRHGTCALHIMGADKKRELTMAIKAFLDEYEERIRACSSVG